MLGTKRPRLLLNLTVVAALGTGLAACESASALLGSNGPSAGLTQDAIVAKPAQPSVRRVVMPPVLGAPPPVAAEIATQLNAAALKRDIALMVDAKAEGEFTLRGYVFATRDKKGVAKLTYTWDLNDRSGARVDRITGEETGDTATGKQADAWSSIPTDALARVAERTIAAVAAASEQKAQLSAPATTAGTSPQPR